MSCYESLHERPTHAESLWPGCNRRRYDEHYPQSLRGTAIRSVPCPEERVSHPLSRRIRTPSHQHKVQCLPTLSAEALSGNPPVARSIRQSVTRVVTFQPQQAVVATSPSAVGVSPRRTRTLPHHGARTPPVQLIRRSEPATPCDR